MRYYWHKYVKKMKIIAQLKQKDNNLILKIIELQHSVNLKENEHETLKSNVKSLDDKIRYMISKSNANMEKMNSTTAPRSLCNTRRKRRLLKPTGDDQKEHKRNAAVTHLKYVLPYMV